MPKDIYSFQKEGGYSFFGEPLSGAVNGVGIGADWNKLSTYSNTFLEDIERGGSVFLSDVLTEVSGVPVRFLDGTVAAPGASWGTEITSGLYKIGTNRFGFSIGGVQKVEFNSSGLGLPNGSAGSPSLAFSTHTDTGLYLSGISTPGFTAVVDGDLKTSWSVDGFLVLNLSSGRVPIVAAAGLLTDDSGLTYSLLGGFTLDVGLQVLIGASDQIKLHSTADSYYNGSGNFGFGTASPTAQVHITEGTDPQLRLGYLDAAYAQLNFDGQLKVSIASGQGNEMTFAGSDSGVNYMFQVRNDDNASTNSDASVQIQVGGTSAGAPYMVFDILGGTSWIVGNDNADSDIFKIVTDTGGGFNGNDGLTIDSNGIYVYNTYTNSSNYERGVFRWSSNVLEIGTEETGTGSTRDVYFIIRQQATTSRWYFRYGSHAVWSVGPSEIRPEAGDSYDLGTSTFKVRDLWLQSTIFIGSSTSSEADSSTGIRLSNARYISGRNATDAGDIGIIGVNASNAIVIGPALSGSPTEVVPGADDTISLGSSSAKWSAGYFDLANVGTTTDAAASGDFAAGLTGASRLFWDQSAALLALYNSTTATNLYASGGFLGINTSGPDRRLDVLDASNPQLRLTHTDGSVYSDLKTDASGYLQIDTSGGRVGIENSSPQVLLHLGEGGSIQGAIRLESAGATGRSANLRALSAGGIQIDTASNAFQIQLDGSQVYISSPLGVRQTTPGVALHVGTGGSIQGYLRLESAGATSRVGNIYSPSGGGIQMDTSGNGFPILLNGSSVQLYPTTVQMVDISSTAFIFNDGGLDKDFRVESDDESYCLMVEGTLNNVVLCANSEPGFNSMDGGIFIAEANVVPAGNPTSGGYMYVESGALKWRSPAGTITTMGAA